MNNKKKKTKTDSDSKMNFSLNTQADLAQVGGKRNGMQLCE